MVKTLRISDENHKDMLKIQGQIQAKSGEFTSMDDVIAKLTIDIPETVERQIKSYQRLPIDRELTWKDHKGLVRDKRIETLKNPDYHELPSELFGIPHESKEDELERLEKERDSGEGNPS